MLSASTHRPLSVASLPAQPIDATQALISLLGFQLQGLTGPFVELTRHLVGMGLRVHRQVCSLRKVLSQQTIGVLIGAALPLGSADYKK